MKSFFWQNKKLTHFVIYNIQKKSWNRLGFTIFKNINPNMGNLFLTNCISLSRCCCCFICGCRFAQLISSCGFFVCPWEFIKAQQQQQILQIALKILGSHTHTHASLYLASTEALLIALSLLSCSCTYTETHTHTHIAMLILCKMHIHTFKCPVDTKWSQHPHTQTHTRTSKSQQIHCGFNLFLNCSFCQRLLKCSGYK